MAKLRHRAMHVVMNKPEPANLRVWLRNVRGLTALTASIGYGVAGVAFTLGSLLLARHMPVEAFGQFMLVVAAYNICAYLGPLGVDQVLLRRNVDPGLPLLIRVVVTACLVAAGVAAAMMLGYGLPLTVTSLLAGAVLAGSLSTAGSAGLRRHGWRVLSMFGVTISSWALLAAGMASLFFTFGSAVGPAVLLFATSSIAAVIAWTALVRNHRVARAEREAFPNREATWLMLATLSGSLVLHGERMVIPYRIDYAALATFTVLAAVAIFPFRLMRFGASFALVPQLRAAGSRQARQQLLWAELRTMAIVLVVASFAMVFVAPPVAALMTDGRYDLPWLLVLAACFNGGAKLMDGLPRSIITACGTAAEVRTMVWLSWLGVACALAGLWIGGAWGLMGLICGSALGNLIGSLPNALVARRALKRGFVG